MPTKYNVPNTYGGQDPSVMFHHNLLQQKNGKKKVKRRTVSKSNSMAAQKL